MARKSGKPQADVQKRTITIHDAFIPNSNHRGRRPPIQITDTGGRMHQIQPLGSLVEDVRTFVAGRTVYLAKKSNGFWQLAKISATPGATAPAEQRPIQQSRLL